MEEVFLFADQIQPQEQEEEREEPLQSNYPQMIDAILLRSDQPGNSHIKP